MNIDYLKNFITIVEEGNILSASKKLFIAQPSLTNQLKYLEEEYHCQLLIRGRKVKLTESGKILYNDAKKIVNSLEAIYKDISNLENGEVGSVDIAIPPTVYQELIQKNFYSFIQKYPNIVINLYELQSQQALKAIEEGKCEIAITNAFISNDEKYNIIDLGKEDYKVFVFEDSVLKDKEKITLQDLLDQNIVIPRAYVNNIKALCSKENVKFNLIGTTTSSMGSIEMARLKNSLAIVPLPENEKIVKELEMVPLIYQSDIIYTRKLIYAKDKKLSNASQFFIDCIKNNFNN